MRGPAVPTPTHRLRVLTAALIAGCLPLVALPAMSRRPDLAPLLFLLGAAGSVILARPQWLAPVFAGVTWTAIGASQFGGVSPVELGGLVLLGVALAHAVTRRQVAGEALVVMALLGLPIIVASMLSADQAGIPVNRLRDLTFVFLIALTLRGERDVERATTVLAAIGIFLGAGAAYSVLVHPTALFPLQLEPSGLPAQRAAGPFQESNFYALAMAALLPLALRVLARGGAWQVLGFSSVLCIFAGVLATGSRGGLVASIAGVAVFTLWTRQRQVLRGSIVLLLLGALLLPVFGSQLESSSQRTVGGRAAENRIALAMFADHPLTGVGPGEYMIRYRDYARKIGNDPRPVRASHDLVLEIAAEQGIVGLAGLLGAVLAMVTAIRRRGANRTVLGQALVTSLLVYAIGSLFLHGSQLRLPYILIGLTLALDGSVRSRLSGAR
jgi:O-antigen ligase